MKKIVCIVGTLDLYQGKDGLWKNLEHAFLEKYPDYVFFVEYKTYLPFQTKRVKDFADSILKKHDKEGDEVILLGFSWGGAIACRLSQKMTQSKIVGIVTINTPHLFINTKPDKNIPLVSCGSIFDIFVPFFITRGGVNHTLFWADHFLCFMYNKKFAEAMAMEARKHIPACVSQHKV